MSKNPYEVLGVEQTATSDEIKKAFRKLAQQHHPDRNPDDSLSESKFKEINEAYQTLSDSTKRAAYDISTATGGYNNLNQIMNDLFRNKAWGDSRGTKTQAGTWSPESDVPGEDIHVDLEVSFDESIHGCKKSVKIRGNKSTVKCSVCLGFGAQPGSRTTICNSCGGHGRGVSSIGSVTNVRKCAACRGRGSIPLSPCRACHGRGLSVYEKDIIITVPSGVDTGQQLRLSGIGTPGHPPGDLFVTISVQTDGKFTRSGMNISCSTSITMKQAIVGCNTTFDGPEGSPICLRVPPGTQPGDIITLPGAGIVGALSKTRGDLKVCINVSLPKKLSPRGEKLLEELEAECQVHRV